MDQRKTGELIKQLRTERKLTQKQLAEQLHVSDKAVSKWECGNGCPDIALLSELADVFGTDIQTLLSGKIEKNESEKGNMKKLKFYICKSCGNFITSASEASVSCCGNKLSVMEPRKALPEEQLSVEELDAELFVSSEHEMSKEHYIAFVCLLHDSTAVICRQYPEWNLQCRFPQYRTGRLVWYCTQCGLLYQDFRISPPKTSGSIR